MSHHSKSFTEKIIEILVVFFFVFGSISMGLLIGGTLKYLDQEVYLYTYEVNNDALGIHRKGYGQYTTRKFDFDEFHKTLSAYSGIPEKSGGVVGEFLRAHTMISHKKTSARKPKPVKAWGIVSLDGKIVHFSRENDENLWLDAFFSKDVPEAKSNEIENRNATEWMKWKGYRCIRVLITPE